MDTGKVLSIASAPNPTLNSINVEDLHKMLKPAQTVAVTFPSEKRLQAYRRSLYSINKQGTFRYRTIRDETQMWGIIVWRMK